MSRIVRANIQVTPSTRGDSFLAVGYAPHLRCADGQYLGVKVASLIRQGNQLVASFELVYPGVNYDMLEPGASFQIVEGPNVVGSGTVVGA